MRLSEDEQALVARLKKRRRNFRRLRWLMLLLSVLCVGVSVYGLTVLYRGFQSDSAFAVAATFLAPVAYLFFCKLLDQALTDAFYSALLAFDGCARLGELEQQSFQIQAEDGSLVCRGDGRLEGLAYESFHKKTVA